VASGAADRSALGAGQLFLAFALRSRFERTRDTTDALAALASFGAVASIRQMAAADRIHALDEAGSLASQIGHLAEAREAWATAVRMLPRGDHSRLREARPDLAERLDSVRRELDGGSAADVPGLRR